MIVANEVIRLLPFFVLLPGLIVGLFVAGWIERRRRRW